MKENQYFEQKNKMAYSDFTLRDIKEQFGISNKVSSLFNEIQPIAISKNLAEALEIARLLPVRSEKAKSELIVMPILIELLKRNQQFFTIYSGDFLNADKEKGLAGECDFILAKNVATFDLHTPLLTMVEAKKHDIPIGVPQCAAQMVGTRYYNKLTGEELEKIYGCVTTGNEWLFLKLEGDTLTVDNRRYYLGSVEKVLGIFQIIINYYKEMLE